MNEGMDDMTANEKELSKYKRLLAKEDFSKYPKDDLENSIETLETIIAENHKYIFVGRVGQFCPIKPGSGGGVLYRENDGKYFAAAGTKGYRWLESEMVKKLTKENDIDRGYYDKLVDDAVDEISKYGDFYWFVSDSPYIPEEGF